MGKGGGSGGGGKGGKGDNTVQLDKEVAGHLLGVNERNLNDIKKASGAEIAIIKCSDMLECVVSGNPQAVKKAKDMLHSQAAASKERGWGTPGWSKEGDGWQDEDSHVIKVSRADGMKVIGKAGMVSKRIRQESGAHVNLDVDAEDDEGCPVRISGSFEAVDKARSMIIDVLKSEEPMYTEWVDESYMKISHNESKRLIGKGGAHIKEIRETCKAKIDVDKETGSPNDVVLVRLTGSIDAVSNTRMMIVELLKGKRIEDVVKMDLIVTTAPIESDDREERRERRKGSSKAGREDRGEKSSRKGGGKISRFGRKKGGGKRG